MGIVLLPDAVIDRIAAGEVVERPASVLKELLENALDAGANRIDILLNKAGCDKIALSDNGCGMARDMLALAVRRHATSKLTRGKDGAFDISEMAYLGFRGEALPAIGSVARLSITSRPDSQEQAFCLDVDSGKITGPRVASLPQTGTKVEVQDLFASTPARLKFLRSKRAEEMACVDVIKRIALSRPDVAFTLTIDGKLRHRFEKTSNDHAGLLKRAALIMPADFADNAIEIDAQKDEMILKGLVGLPTFARGLPDRQYFFVNGRTVRDRLLISTLRVGYLDVLEKNRYPVGLLFVQLLGADVDVNVHPAKTEVRFRNPYRVRAFLISALQRAIAAASQRSATTGARFALDRMQPQKTSAHGEQIRQKDSEQPSFTPQFRRSDVSLRPGTTHQPVMPPAPVSADLFDSASLLPNAQTLRLPEDENSAQAGGETKETSEEAFPLGAPRAQLFETYIVAQSRDGIVIVDQHAAHERLVYERLKKARASKAVERQILLVPEIVSLEQERVELLDAHKAELRPFGLVIEKFDEDSLLLRETPSMLGLFDYKGMLAALADDIRHFGRGLEIEEKIDHLCSTMACHHSIRAGRRMLYAEMSALLRSMENTLFTGQCNHGRPTYIKLARADIEKLFHRR